ncbi:MAG: PKD domain-containing protein, partial [Bacteroidales bacterium]|nr:PKD domain-containing protein [Bacteroidales bacterium]
CPGSFSVLSANTGVGYQYQWYKNDTVISNATTSFYQAQDSGSYFAAIKNIYDCSDTTNTIDINVYDLPTATINNSGANSFCDGDSVLLSANQDAGLSYVWFRNGNIITGESNSTLSVKNAGDYKVEISNVNACIDISSLISINVNPRPSPSITAGGALSFCDGNSVLLYGSNGVGYSYQWYKDASVISGATSSFVSISESGDYTVYIENSYQCGDTGSAVSVVVNPSPTSVINVLGLQTVCQGDTVILSGNSVNGLTYQWKSYGTNLAGATDSVYHALQTGNYTLVTTNSFSCYTESAQQLAVVNPVPGASVLPLSSTSFCGGDSVILQANTGNGLTYQWYKNSVILLNDTLVGYNANSSGAFAVEVRNEYNCYSISASSNITVFPVPTASFNLANEVCSSDTIQIQYLGSASAGAFYNWNFNGATVLSGTGQGPYEIQWLNAGAKSVSLMVNENSCSSLSFSDTTIVKSVNAVITAPITSVCQGDTVLLTANSGQNLDYQWLLAGVDMNNDTLSSVSVVNTGLYQVRVIDASIGCYQVSTPMLVTVNTTDFSLNFIASTTNFTQPPFDVTINNTTPNMNEYNFQWELGDGNTSTFYNPIHTYQYNGTYTVAMYAENSTTGCRDTLVNVDYIVCAGGSPNPCNIIAAITPAGPATICNGDSVLLSASAGTGYNYQWVYNSVIIPNADSIALYAKQSGNYRVIVSDAICSQTSPAFILNNYPSIEPNIQASGNIQPCTIDSLNLSLLVNYNSYNWNTGSSTASIYVYQTGYYQVEVTDNYGCIMTSEPYIVSNSYLNPPELCLVGVDSLNHNRLVWERQSNALIDSFYVYKEGFIAGQYDKIGAVPFTQSSIFVDQNSNPAIKAYRYKIAAVDTCGGITLLGDYHKTIHLTINAGLNGSWNLIWDGYEGFAFNTYRIYRGTNSNNMSLLTQLSSTANSYTDLNPPTGTVYYQIEVIKTTGCYPDTTIAKVNTNYNSSRSNTANNANMTPVYLAAEFDADIQSGIWPIQVSFNDNSTGDPDAWHWNFGDGNTSIEQHPSHTYNNTGVYTVKLAICNGGICDTIIKIDYIEVLPNGMVEVGVAIAAKLYPNPNDGSFTIEINDKSQHEVQLHIYNSLGAQVYFEEFESNGKTVKRLQLNDLSTGVYYVHLNTKDKVVYSTKVVIQK